MITMFLSRRSEVMSCSLNLENYTTREIYHFQSWFIIIASRDPSGLFSLLQQIYVSQILDFTLVHHQIIKK